MQFLVTYGPPKISFLFILISFTHLSVPCMSMKNQSVEVTSPIKSISEHLPRNVEPTSTKIVVNRISNRQRKVPVTRNDDFLW
jgi:hypothetical protein